MTDHASPLVYSCSGCSSAAHGVREHVHTDPDPRHARQLTDELAGRIAAGEHLARRRPGPRSRA